MSTCHQWLLRNIVVLNFCCWSDTNRSCYSHQGSADRNGRISELRNISAPLWMCSFPVTATSALRLCSVTVTWSGCSLGLKATLWESATTQSAFSPLAFVGWRSTFYRDSSSPVVRVQILLIFPHGFLVQNKQILLIDYLINEHVLAKMSPGIYNPL